MLLAENLLGFEPIHVMYEVHSNFEVYREARMCLVKCLPSDHPGGSPHNRDFSRRVELMYLLRRCTTLYGIAGMRCRILLPFFT